MWSTLRRKLWLLHLNVLLIAQVITVVSDVKVHIVHHGVRVDNIAKEKIVQMTVILVKHDNCAYCRIFDNSSPHCGQYCKCESWHKCVSYCNGSVQIIVDNTAKEKSAHMAVMEHTAANIVELVLSAVGLI